MHGNQPASSEWSQKGYSAGYADGFRDGACEAIVRRIQTPPEVIHDLRVMYVPQGFEAIDQGLIAALRRSVRELHVVDAKRMAEQAAALRPDWMIVLNGLHVFPSDHLKQAEAVRAMGIRTAIWFADDPYVTADTVAIVSHYDVILTHELGTVKLYQDLGCRKVFYIPLAVHPELFKPQKTEARYRSDICFIGQAFWNRVELLDEIADYLAGRRVFIAGGLWDRLKHYKKLRRAIRPGWLPVSESIKYYNGAKIVINIHRTTVPGMDNKNALNMPGLSINPRTYEIAACGTLQLTDIREDLPRHFRPGSEIETFSGPNELREKLIHYLAHDEERLKVALRGLQRTLTDHTYRSRMGHLAAALEWQ